MHDDNSEKEYDFEATLIFLFDRKDVWLAPKEAKIGEKRLNGPGGGIEPFDVSLRACAKREAEEEFGVHVEEKDLELCAIGYFTNIKNDGTYFMCKVYIYTVRRWVGIPKKSREMGKPKKYSRYNMPFEKMMAADRHWIPEIFKGKKIIVRATMKNKQSELVGNVEIVEVVTFD